MKNWVVPLILVCLGHFSIDLYMNMLPGVMPTLIETMGITLTLSGLIQTVLSVTSSWLQPIFGYIAFRLKTQRALMIAVLLSAVFMPLIGLAKNFWILLLVVTLGGMGSSIYHPIGSVAIADLASKNQGLVMALYITVGTLGTTLAPVATSLVNKFFGLKGILFLGIPGIITGLVLYLFKDSLKNIKRAEPVKARTASKFKMNQSLALLVIIIGLRTWALTTFTLYIPVYFVSKGTTDELASGILSLYLIFQSLGGVFGGFLSDKVGMKKILVISSVLGIFCFSMFFMTSGYISVIMLFLGAAVVQSAFPGSVVLAQNLFPANPGMATGFMQGFTFGLGSLGTLVTGALSDIWGGNLEMALKTIPIVLVLSFVGSLFVPSEKYHNRVRKGSERLLAPHES